MSLTDLVIPWTGSGKMNGCATDWWKNGSGCRKAVDCASAALTHVGEFDNAKLRMQLPRRNRTHHGKGVYPNRWYSF